MFEPRIQSPMSLGEGGEDFEVMNFYDGGMDGAQEAAAETASQKKPLPDVGLFELRSKLGMTQRRFAELLGISCRTVEAWESGVRAPTPPTQKLFNLLWDDPSLIQKL